MKLYRTLRAAFAAAFFVTGSAAFAQLDGPPDAIDYQGRLLNSLGGPITGSGGPGTTGTATNYEIRFRIWDAQSGGNLIWAEEQITTVTDEGFFSVRLGEGEAITVANGDSLPLVGSVPHATGLPSAFDGNERYLGVTVMPNGAGTPGEIAPRLAFLTVPFAVVAEKARFAESGPSGGNFFAAQIGVNNASPSRTLDVNGTFRVDGSGVIMDLTSSANYKMALFGASGRQGLLGSSSADAFKVGNSSGNANLFSVVDTTDSNAAEIRIAPGGTSSYQLTMGTDDTGVYWDNTSSIRGYRWSNSNGELMRIDKDGQVGIGTTPSRTLDVAGTFRIAGMSVPMELSSSNNPYKLWLGGATGTEGYIGSSAGDSFKVASSLGHDLFSITDTAETNPGSFRVSPGNAGVNLEVTLGTDTTGTYWKSNRSSRGFRWNINEDGKMIFGSSNGGSLNIGNGESVSGYPLYIANTVNNSLSGVSFDDSSSTDLETPPASASVSIRAVGWIWGLGFVASSDQRIKNVQGRSGGEEDLATLMQLKVTDYTMRDRIQLGSREEKGFIAQEVQEIIPEAVSAGRDFIPDVYRPAMDFAIDPAAETCRITLSQPHGLVEGLTVKVIVDDAPHHVRVTGVEDANTFVVEAPPAGEKLFVYGREVDDFLSVKYDRIFTTAVSALQQLKIEKDEEISALNDTNAQLRSQLAAQEQRLRALEQRDRERDAKFAAIEKLLKGRAEVHPVSTGLTATR